MADEEEKENFYEQLQAVLDKAPRRDLKILMGDLNAKVGTDNTDRELIMGKHGTGTQNENGELFTEFCTTNDLRFKIKLKAYRDQADRPSHKYNVHSLKESVKTNAFRCELRNRFSALDTLPEETIEEHWHDLRETWTATCREVLGKKTRQHKEWLTSDTWDLITERKRLKDLINHTDDQDDKRDLQAQYWDVNRQTEIIKAIKSLKSGKAAGPDGIPPEALKADIQTSSDMLHPLLRNIWESESVPPRLEEGTPGSHQDHPGEAEDRAGQDTREEQAGFRNDRSCTDHIATMRIIIEQSLEWQTPLYSTFVDFQKAFDSVDREVIWKLMSHYGFPPKFVNIIRQLYEDATCQVIHDGKLTEPFTVRTGVRQGCILSPTIFLMVVDWVMRQATDGKRTGIQWTFSKQLEDLDFADDIALLLPQATRCAGEAEQSRRRS
nr:hypothetical protein BaRGS_027495 [Batillaria attramentaria]